MNFIERDGKEVFEEDFLEFAGYNIQRRAIPDARDGLKWGARKLLHSQMLGKFTHDKPFKKATKSVAQAMGFSYTHGTSSAYGTFIRMAKPFAYRVPLQEVKGNYGTLISPSDHSADRYVEMRGSEAAACLLKDLNKNTIGEWEDTYDMEGQFPKVLPAKGFWGGINGCISIGSGMASSLPPLNLKETNEAMIKLLWNPDLAAEDVVVYPDFPTGGIILNKDEVKESLINGTGRACRVRSVIEWDEKNRLLIVKELPYSTYTNTICKELSDIINSEENIGIKDFYDYTGKAPDLQILVDKKLSVQRALAFLYKNTSLESHFSINMTVLDKGITPCVMGQKELFLAHLDHEIEVYTRGFQYDLAKVRKRLHIVEGLLKAILHLDEVVPTIKNAADTKTASRDLQLKFGFSEEQAKAVLDIKLARLAHLETEKLMVEKKSLLTEEERITAILENKDLLYKEIETGLREVADKFGDERRTQILNIGSADEEEVEEVKSYSIGLSNHNNLYVTETSTLYTQNKRSVGSKYKLKKGEYITHTCAADSNDQIFFFTETGNLYGAAVNKIISAGGGAVEQFIQLAAEESICLMCNSSKEPKKYLVIITKKGYLKKSEFAEYRNLKRTKKLKCVELSDGDEICAAIPTNGELDIGFLTAKGHFVHYGIADIKPLKRVARGVMGIKLNDGDQVVSARELPAATAKVVSVSKAGQVKITKIEELSKTTRYAKGSKVQSLREGDQMVDFLPTIDERIITLISDEAQLKFELNSATTAKGGLGTMSMKLKPHNHILKILGD